MNTKPIRLTLEEVNAILQCADTLRQPSVRQETREQWERIYQRLITEWNKPVKRQAKKPEAVAGIKLLTVDDVSAVLGIHRTTIRMYLRAGLIKGRKIGWRYYVTEDSLKEFIERS
jgi:excisionase family DNA binding protein